MNFSNAVKKIGYRSAALAAGLSALSALGALLPVGAWAAPPAAAASAAAAAPFRVTRANLAKTASFKVTLTTAPKGGAPITRLYDVRVNGNDARVDYQDPALGSVRYLVNAQGTFLYIPENKTATRYTFKGGVDAALQQAFRFITAQGRDLKKIGMAAVSGQPTVEYKNVKNGALVYVGQRPGFRLPVKAILANEGGTQSFIVTNITLGGSAPAAQFALPAGTQIISGENGGMAGLPGGGSIPGGGKGE